MVRQILKLQKQYTQITYKDNNVVDRICKNWIEFGLVILLDSKTIDGLDKPDGMTI